MQAWQIAAGERSSQPVQYKLALTRIIGLLAKIEGHAAPITIVKAQPAAEQAALYVRLAYAAIEQRDSASSARLLPETIEALTETPPTGSLQTVTLFELARRLAVGGYSSEAKSLAATLPGSPNGPPNLVIAAAAARLKADMGDLSGGLEAADALGPLTTKPGPAAALIATAMQFGSSATRPTNDEINAALERTKAALPPLVAGPKAHALSEMAMDLAVQGNVAGALQAEAGLEAEPRDVLSGPRDTALTAIAESQIKAGELRDALATTLKITHDTVRWEGLLKLAMKPPVP